MHCCATLLSTPTRPFSERVNSYSSSTYYSNMTLGDKIKHALHMDKDKTGSASETGTGVTSAGGYL